MASVSSSSRVLQDPNAKTTAPLKIADLGGFDAVADPAPDADLAARSDISRDLDGLREKAGVPLEAWLILAIVIASYINAAASLFG
ncbi:MAG: hypothetical protein GC147_06695 [Porphyrobacter sp.]|nr:hypothetical protein [Porphyrobacter sp.]